MNQKLRAEKVVNVNLLECETLKCQNQRLQNGDEDSAHICGNETFIPKTNIRIVPAIMSPTGQKVYASLTYFFCSDCGAQLSDEKGQPFVIIGQ